jgi:hypothetical protein
MLRYVERNSHHENNSTILSDNLTTGTLKHADTQLQYKAIAGPRHADLCTQTPHTKARVHSKLGKQDLSPNSNQYDARQHQQSSVHCATVPSTPVRIR